MNAAALADEPKDMPASGPDPRTDDLLPALLFNPIAQDHTPAMNMSIPERVRATVAAALSQPDSAVTMTTSADNQPAWDSLAHVNLMMAIEQTFDVQLEVEDFSKLTSVQAIVEHLAANGIV